MRLDGGWPERWWNPGEMSHNRPSAAHAAQSTPVPHGLDTVGFCRGGIGKSGRVSLARAARHAAREGFDAAWKPQENPASLTGCGVYMELTVGLEPTTG